MMSWADIYIITHPSTPIQSISRKDLAAIYLRKKRYWKDDSPIVPINLSALSPLRDQFTQTIFNRAPHEMGGYWNKMSFKGIHPPLIQSSEQTALLFIQRVPNTIAYVSSRPDNNLVKVLLTLTTQ